MCRHVILNSYWFLVGYYAESKIRIKKNHFRKTNFSRSHINRTSLTLRHMNIFSPNFKGNYHKIAISIFELLNATCINQELIHLTQQTPNITMIFMYVLPGIRFHFQLLMGILISNIHFRLF